MKTAILVGLLITGLLALIGGFVLVSVLNHDGKKEDDLKTHLTPLKDTHHTLQVGSGLYQGTKPKDTKCSCFRGGDTVQKMVDGKRKWYDEGFCGRCIGGVVYGCPSLECGGECEKLLFSGPECTECNGDEKNPFCVQTVENLTEASTK
jgi:hypothetical protein